MMKIQKNLFTALVALLLTSCGSTIFYQVYKVEPSDKLINKDAQLVYEDENCKVSYNLWADGGNIGFQFYNKTDNIIYLNLGESFFILNGVSYNYYRNRVFTNSASSGTAASKSLTGINYSDLLQTNKLSATNTVGIMASSGFSISFNEEKIVCIPSKTSKIIAEYNINKSLFRDCDLFKYPTKKQIRSKTFSKELSPFVFSNRIAYTIGHSDNLIKLENEFYVTEISNYPEKEICKFRNDEYCGQKSVNEIKYFKNTSAEKFYIRYNKGQDVWMH